MRENTTTTLPDFNMQTASSVQTVSNVPDYKTRMAYEYRQTAERLAKLHKILVKLDAGTLEFPLRCPSELLRKQENTMTEYLRILEIRAEIEGVEL